MPIGAFLRVTDFECPMVTERDSDPKAEMAAWIMGGERVEVFCFQPTSSDKSCGWKVGSVWDTEDSEVLISFGVFQEGEEWSDRTVFLDTTGETAPGLCPRHGRRLMDLAQLRQKAMDSLSTHRKVRCGSTAFS